MKLVYEKTFPIVAIGKNDTVTVTYTHKGRELVHFEDKQVIRRAVNCLRVYEAEDFGGMKDCTISVLGYKL